MAESTLSIQKYTVVAVSPAQKTLRLIPGASQPPLVYSPCTCGRSWVMCLPLAPFSSLAERMHGVLLEDRGVACCRCAFLRIIIALLGKIHGH